MMGVFDSLTRAFGVSREMKIDEFMSAAEAEEVDVLHKESRSAEHNPDREKPCAVEGSHLETQDLRYRVERGYSED